MRSSGWALGANISFVISGTPPDFSVAWRALSGACQHFSTPPGFAPPRCPNTRCSDVVYAATNGRGLVAGTDLAGGPGPIGVGRCSLSRWSPGYMNYALSRFSEVRLVLLRRVCGLLFFLYSLQTFDLLEGEAHYAAVLALVLKVDCLLVVVDEDLRRHPAAVVEPLCPLRDVFVLYLLGLLAHPFAPCLASDSLPRRGSIYSSERGLETVSDVE